MTDPDTPLIYRDVDAEEKEIIPVELFTWAENNEVWAADEE
jgi:hypothetical protein